MDLPLPHARCERWSSHGVDWYASKQPTIFAFHLQTDDRNSEAFTMCVFEVLVVFTTRPISVLYAGGASQAHFAVLALSVQQSAPFGQASKTLVYIITSSILVL